MDTSISSASRTSWSQTTRTAPPWIRPRPRSEASVRSQEVTRAPVRILTPLSVRESATICEAKGSNPDSGRDPRTSMVTLLPRADIQVAASQATAPPPTMMSRPGTSCIAVTSRDPHACTPCSSRGTTGCEPVARTTACRASSRRFPSGVLTATRRSPFRRAQPRITSMPALAAQKTCPASSYWETHLSRRRSSPDTETLAGSSPVRWAVAAATSSGRSSALLGMQA